MKETHAENIVTNPPFKDKTQDLNIKKWVEHCLKICKGKVAVFARVSFLESEDRFGLLEENPPSSVYAFSNRMCCKRNGNDADSSAVFYAWFVWDRRKPRPENTKLKIIKG